MAVTEVAKPFDATPIATALEFRKRNRPATGAGLVDASYGSTALQVTASGGTSINIANGRAVIQGALYELSGGPKNIAVSANGTGSNRADWAVLTYDDSHTPGVYARTLEGTALTQNDTGVWDEPLASWQKTPAGTIQNLIDWRPWRGSTVRPCTSTARPRNPTLGQHAYEADTGRVIFYDGTGWPTAYEDTGWVSLPMNGGDAGAWTANVTNRIRLRNGVVHMRISIKRQNGLTLPTSDDGSRVFMLPEAFWPTVTEWVSGYHTRSPVMLRVETNGEVRVYPLTDDIPGGRTVQASGTWLKG
ncbi:hypothetical protein [Actinomadura sp. GTD37]|uniref:hypothetical protein n=1 Tax=Actinomadura sp. GTD37 TaxID=1778030 RepID=UPI0035C05626